jgi:organic radical activating enzyme
MSKHGCSLPYRQINISPIGEFNPCCQYQSIDDEHMHINTIQEYLESDVLQKIKDDLAAGIKIPQCNHCWKDEAALGRSMRSHRISEPIPTIKELFIEFGNICNAACRICHSGRSSLIGQHDAKWLKANPASPLKEELAPSNFFRGDKFWYKGIADTVLPIVEDLDYIQISGGEPFINPHFDDFIDTLIASGKKLPNIRITTNGSFTAAQIEKLRNFDNFSIYLSTDSMTPEYYNHLRWPLKYTDLQRSIKILQDYTCDGEQPKYEFQLVIQNLNLLDIVPSLQWFNAHLSDDPRFYIAYTMLHSSQWYSIHNTPKRLRDQVLVDLHTIDFHAHSKFTGQSLDHVDYHPHINPNEQSLKKLLAQDQPYHDLTMLRNHVEYTDKTRGVDTWDFIGWHPDELI